VPPGGKNAELDPNPKFKKKEKMFVKPGYFDAIVTFT
jgi:hypothetical protein